MPGNLLDLIKLDEGLRLKAYKDTLGHWTIGYGHLLGDDPKWEGHTLTYLEAEHVLEQDIKLARDGLANLAPWYLNLDEVRQAVLVSMVFNLGVAGLKKWPVFLGQICNYAFEAAARNMRSTLWAKQVKTRAERLARMMETGTWPNEAGSSH